MIPVKGYAVKNAKSKLAPFQFKRRSLGPHDVLIEIHYCGICHSDIHQVRNEWGTSKYPMVPGHEIVGKVMEVGAKVRRFESGDAAGVGCFVDSCRRCRSCRASEEQYCEKHISWTYNGTLQDQKTPTFGGYSSHIVVDEKYVLEIPSHLPLAEAAPLLCAGITTYSPLKHFKVRKGARVGIVGMGGLGHMAVKLAASMGAKVSVFSTSRSKEEDARRFGAHAFYSTQNRKVFDDLANQFDFMLDTVSAEHDLNDYLNLLKLNGTLCLVGVPENPAPIEAFSLIGKRRRLAGSLIGGIRETQEMLDYCGKMKIVPDIEVLPVTQVNEAYARLLKGDVRYRFVLDVKNSI